MYFASIAQVDRFPQGGFGNRLIGIAYSNIAFGGDGPAPGSGLEFPPALQRGDRLRTEIAKQPKGKNKDHIKNSKIYPPSI